MLFSVAAARANYRYEELEWRVGVGSARSALTLDCRFSRNPFLLWLTLPKRKQRDDFGAAPRMCSRISVIFNKSRK